MSGENQTETNQEKETSWKENISGIGQAIIGEIEIIGGILTADPLTRAEGEFNLDVGSKREEIEEEIERKQSEE